MLTSYTLQELSNKNFSSLIESAKEVDEDDFVQLGREGLGEQLNFLDAIPMLKEIHRLLTEFPPERLLENTSASDNELAEYPRKWLLSVSNILKMNVVHDNPNQTRTKILSDITALKASVISNLFGIILYLRSLEANDDERIEKRFEPLLQELHKKSNEVMQDVERVRNARSEAENAAEAAQMAAAETGFDTQSGFFQEAARQSAKTARRWLIATLFGTVALVGAIFSFDIVYGYIFGALETSESENHVDNWIQYFSTKFITISAFAFLVILFRKNYLSNLHNNVVNGHRANALMTFRALSEASQSEQSTEIILQAAAACIFSHQDTGYSKNGGQDANIPQIVLNPTANPSI